MSEKKNLHYENASIGHAQPVKYEYPYKESWVVFAWICEQDHCTTVNYLSWNHYDVYGPVDECLKCGKAFHIKVPWK